MSKAFALLQLPGALTTWIVVAWSRYINIYGCDVYGYDSDGYATDSMIVPCDSPSANPIVTVVYMVSFIFLTAFMLVNVIVGRSKCCCCLRLFCMCFT